MLRARSRAVPTAAAARLGDDLCAIHPRCAAARKAPALARGGGTRREADAPRVAAMGHGDDDAGGAEGGADAEAAAEAGARLAATRRGLARPGRGLRPPPEPGRTPTGRAREVGDACVPSCRPEVVDGAPAETSGSRRRA